MTPLEVTRIGADGDGVAALPDGGLAYLPYTLPGESVRPGVLTKRGQGWSASAEILTSSPERQAAPCPHFGSCGGCTLQHWQDAPYAAWKAGQVDAALMRVGFAQSRLGPLARTPRADRRRVDLALVRDGRAVRVGLHQHRGSEVIDLYTCLVLEPSLVALIQILRRVLPGIAGLRKAGSAFANVLDTGIDLLLRTDAPLSAADRTKLAAFAQEAGLCRVSWAHRDTPPEVASQIEPATLSISGAIVFPPAGAFLQASNSGAAAITAAVLAGLPETLPNRAHLIELYAGCGTLTFPLAQRGRVTAYEGDAGAHGALRRAIAGRPIAAIHRDLARQPLTTKEMAGAAVIVLDPPYAGAPAQMPAIAGSGAARVIYVSCNPGALARDARMLQDGGYSLVSSAPVDQFLWSAAVESVSVFQRIRATRR